MKSHEKIGSSRGCPRAFTLVELLVSVAILVIMIMAFGIILNESQRVVSVAQEAMINRTSAAAVSRFMREDISRITKEGFLAIRNISGRQRMVFTAMGPYNSMLDSSKPRTPSGGYINDHDWTAGNVARVDYGYSSGNIIWRRAILQAPINNTINQLDHENMSLGYYRRWSNTDLDNALLNTWSFTDPNGVVRVSGAPPMMQEPVMNIPPRTIDDIIGIWPYMAGNCSQFTIEWSMNGRDWSTADALWSHEDAVWPVALRVRFTIGIAGQEQSHEVIADLPR